MEIVKNKEKEFVLRKSNGFTLLELLIVIAILAVLSVSLVLVLNPAESLRKSRDVQRMSDLATLKTAIGLYMTTVSSPDLSADATAPHVCLGSGVSTATISYSKPLAADPACNIDIIEGTDVSATGTFLATDFCRYETTANYTLTNGEGWVPVNFINVAGGSPISNLPIDPTNTVAIETAPAMTDLVYRYACQEVAESGKPNYVFEINARLESAEYGSTTTGKMTQDGGDNNEYYEVGTSTRLIGGGTNF
jgi:prepilin-type N-terminal cleavage/methylation domain-containing protein